MKGHTMKGMLFLIGLLVFCLPASSQMVLNVGESYTYQFASLPFEIFLSTGGGAPRGAISLYSAANMDLEPGDALLLEIFEGAPTGSPMLSRTLTSSSSAGDFSFAIVNGAWQDRQGSFRLTMLSGSGVIGPIRVESAQSTVFPDPSGVIIYAISVTPPPRPLLKIVPFPPGATLRWPTSASNFVLEATTNLSPPALWQHVTNAATTNSGFISVTVNYQEQRRFFRLRLP
jgi:hypothetical protein